MWYGACLPIFLTIFRLSSFSHSFNFPLIVPMSHGLPLWVPRRVIHGCSSHFPWACGDYQMQIWTFKTLPANGKKCSSFWSPPLQCLTAGSTSLMAVHRGFGGRDPVWGAGNGLSWAKRAPKSWRAVQGVRWEKIMDFLKCISMA